MKNVYKVSPQENASLRTVARMFYNKKYNKTSWSSIDNETRETINMLMAMGFMEWEKVKGGTMIKECHDVNIVFE